MSLKKILKFVVKWQNNSSCSMKERNIDWEVYDGSCHGKNTFLLLIATLIEIDKEACFAKTVIPF